MKRVQMMVAGLMLAAAACSDGGIGAGTGKTKVYLTDDPFPFDSIARVDVYVAKIEASTSLDTTQVGGQDWVTVAEPQQVFNLLDFSQGTTALAGEADLPAGSYRAIRITINTSLSHLVSVHGAQIPVQWPVAGELALNAYVEHAMDVAEEGAQIVIDFDVGRTFVANPAGGFYFIPWIRAVNNAATGSIAGTVTGPDIEGNPTPLRNVSLVVWTNPFPGAAGAILGTGRTDASGHFVVAYLSPGDYMIAAVAPPFYAFNTGGRSVHVTSGDQAIANFSLTRDTSSGGGGGTDTSTVTPGGAVASVTMRVGTPSGSTTIGVCDSIPLTAELRNAQGQILLGRSLAWHVSDSTVISLEGVFGQYAHLRALKAGSSTVSAASEGKSAAVTFTVTGAGGCGGGGGGGGNTNPVATVAINPAAITATLPGNDSVFATTVLKDANGAVLSGRTVTFTVADTTIMRISGVYGQSVLLRAKKAGSTTLTAVSEGKTASASVTVN